MRTIHRSSRGVSLVEAMVALAVMAFGMLTVVGVQSTLRLNADVAKQRSEATRLAQEKLDEWRSFTVVDFTAVGDRAWSTIDDDVSTVNGLNATYEVRREVVTTADPPTKVVRVTVSWSDRAAANANDKNRVMLASSIAAAAPALSGTLAVRPGIAAVGPVRRPINRHPTIPVLARDLGNGQSAFVPPFRPWVVIVFNNVTGVVTGVCDLNYDTSNDTITNSEVAQCSNTTEGQLLTGFVRFQRQDGPGDLTAADVENPPGPALNLRMSISLTSSNHPLTPFCIDDANSTSVASGSLPYATYFCVIYSNVARTWSGITTVVPRTGFGNDWFISDDASGSSPFSDRFYRVCRYTVATSDGQVVANQDHPRNYANVSGNLTNQNFVVIRSTKHCPTDVPANPTAGDLVNSNTLQHQPDP
ncbi:MAG TPA: prepilin-type N-terminal cleavage/methylation domain-containing protein [Burkholderiaceae bacterium]